jgi:hypothetical protein
MTAVCPTILGHFFFDLRFTLGHYSGQTPSPHCLLLCTKSEKLKEQRKENLPGTLDLDILFFFSKKGSLSSGQCGDGT